jgi:peptidoglycan/xylan/chitin deacetylase (PgdA/CDA1 family)
VLIGVNYHYIRPWYDEPYPGIHGITPEVFEHQLKLLGRVGHFVGAAEIGEALAGVRPLPDRAFVVTLDDGLREQYEHAWPILRRLGVPAIFFVNTAAIAERRVLGVHKIHLVRAWQPPEKLLERLGQSGRSGNGGQMGALSDVSLIESIRRRAAAHYNYDDPETACLKYLLNFVLEPAVRDRLITECFEEMNPGAESEISQRLYMSGEELHILSDMGCLGSHGDDHLPLGLLTPVEVRREIERSVERIEAWTGRRPEALSYPYGSAEACAPPVSGIATDLGIRFAFTVERAGNPDLRAPLHLARCDCNDLPGGKAACWEADRLFEEIPRREWYLDEHVA